MTTTMFTSSTSPYSSSSLKRKRDEFGTVMTTNSSPSPAQAPPTVGLGTLNLRGETHSRTMKRIRNKPREREVHDYTLQKLFNAQTSKQSPVETPSQPAVSSSSLPPPSPPPPAPPSAQKTHTRSSISSYFASFFTSKPHLKPPSKQDAPPIPEHTPSIPICEDCDRQLQEREIYLSGSGQCLNCRRTVCSEKCSVAVNDGWGGEGRVCLECALR